MKGKFAQELNAQKLPSFRGLGFGNHTGGLAPDQHGNRQHRHHRGLKRSILKHLHSDGTIAITHGVWDHKQKEFVFPKRK